MTEEQQIAALREEIRRAGVDLWKLRLRWAVAVGAFPTVAVVALLVAHWSNLDAAEPLSPADLHVLRVVFASGIGAGVLVSALLGLAARRSRRIRFGYRLETMPRDEVAAVLLPLSADVSPDVRAMAAPLLREFGVSTELAPAGILDPRSDEASPAEPEP